VDNDLITTRNPKSILSQESAECTLPFLNRWHKFG
jgi:hypothetical protein